MIKCEVYDQITTVAVSIHGYVLRFSKIIGIDFDDNYDYLSVLCSAKKEDYMQSIAPFLEYPLHKTEWLFDMQAK